MYWKNNNNELIEDTLQNSPQRGWILWKKEKSQELVFPASIVKKSAGQLKFKVVSSNDFSIIDSWEGDLYFYNEQSKIVFKKSTYLYKDKIVSISYPISLLLSENRLHERTKLSPSEIEKVSFTLGDSTNLELHYIRDYSQFGFSFLDYGKNASKYIVNQKIFIHSFFRSKFQVAGKICHISQSSNDLNKRPRAPNDLIMIGVELKAPLPHFQRGKNNEKKLSSAFKGIIKNSTSFHDLLTYPPITGPY